LRQGCLDEQLAEVHVLVDLFGQADGGMVEKGDSIIAQLPPIARCANVAALRQPDQPTREQRPKVVELGQKIAEAKAMLIVGKCLASLPAAQQCVAAARKIGFEPQLAEALVVHGAGMLTLGNFEQAGADFSAAVYAAMRGHNDELAAEAGISM